MSKSKKISEVSTDTRSDLSYGSKHQVDQQEALEQFIKSVGARVIAARQRLGMSRRVLAEQSGVSQRTIVLLETGTGNISIALLFRIATALGHTVEWFTAANNQTKFDASQIADYYLTASPVQQQQIKNLLLSNQRKDTKKQRISLIGLRGAGKSTLGQSLSEYLSFPFVELNDEVETISGMPTAELMSLYGPEGYRQLELQALKKIVEEYDQVILAAAGGVVSEEANYQFLLKFFHTVWLKAKPEEHMERVKAQGDVRPMAGNSTAMQELKSILVSRESLYAAADKHVDTSDRSVASSLDALKVVIAPFLRQSLLSDASLKS